MLNSQIKLSPYLCTGLETGFLEPQQSQHIVPGGLGLHGLVDDVPQDHRQSCPAEHLTLVQYGWQSAASHQQRRILQQNTGHIQGLRDVVFQCAQVGMFRQDEVNFERLAATVGQQEQGNGRMQRETWLLILDAHLQIKTGVLFHPSVRHPQ